MNDAASAAIRDGRAVLGLELGSTRIKACLVLADDPSTVLAVGGHSWESRLVDRTWTYALDDVWVGVRDAFADLASEVRRRHGVAVESLAGLGVSAMMHGYLAFDGDGELLTPFRTWRNTNTERSAAALSDLFGMNIPLRWSVAHLYQAVLDEEPHVADVRFLTTLAGYVHLRLSGRKVLGVGDASGMFPIDSATRAFDPRLLEEFDRLVSDRPYALELSAVLPEVLVAGQEAGRLTPAGALLLDPTGVLQPGAPMCPPEGDAGTGMVATCSVAPRTGNVSVGTSIFAMAVLERDLGRVHHEIDLVTTPSGDPVAMVHCNNGASELAAWAGLFERFASASGRPMDSDAVFGLLLREALDGDPDAGGVLAYNHLAGEPIAGLAEGRPLVVRTPGSRFTLANLMRAQLFGALGALALGMRVLDGEGAAVDRMFAHGGVFRTDGVAQRLLAGALDVPIAVAETASEGGAWGIAVLAAYLRAAPGLDLDAYLRKRVFGDAGFRTVDPDSRDVAGFADYLARYRAGLAIEAAAVAAL